MDNNLDATKNKWLEVINQCTDDFWRPFLLDQAVQAGLITKEDAKEEKIWMK